MQGEGRRVQSAGSALAAHAPTSAALAFGVACREDAALSAVKRDGFQFVPRYEWWVPWVGCVHIAVTQSFASTFSINVLSIKARFKTFGVLRDSEIRPRNK